MAVNPPGPPPDTPNLDLVSFSTPSTVLNNHLVNP